VAQPGSALPLGGRGPRFKSGRPDSYNYSVRLRHTATDLLLDAGGFDGGNGFTLASHGEDVHAIGPTSPQTPGYIGCAVIGPDGSRRLARVVPDPLA
jgi:hypothetical protein